MGVDNRIIVILAVLSTVNRCSNAWVSLDVLRRFGPYASRTEPVLLH
jgi:hypothetical protein